MAKFFELPTRDADTGDIERLVGFVQSGSIAVLTGAGCSTESGIPDYRGPETRRRARNPIQYRGFVDDEANRRRYWARSVIGWPRIRSARPNHGHYALASLEARGIVRGVVTQNVDRLHSAAGSERVVELHGALADVRCLECDDIEPRDALQQRLIAKNRDWLERRVESARQVESAPDGDAELGGDAHASFEIAGCRTCGGVLKPDVVFFGENARSEVVEAAFALVDDADALMVVGSSLAVYSGLRFVKRAASDGKPVALVNLGPTMRGMEHVDLHVDARAGETLSRLAERVRS